MKLISILAVLGLFTVIAVNPPPGEKELTRKERRILKKEARIQTGTEVGDIAPDIVLNNFDNKPISLYSLRGKYVLVDFWASWCAPCRQENPNVVAVYKKYGKAHFKEGKGFEIYSVSLDQDAARWKSAVEKDGLIWKNHVSDLQKWKSKAVVSFGVDHLPMSFLIDPNGKIIAKDLRGDKLHMALDKLITGF